MKKIFSFLVFTVIFNGLPCLTKAQLSLPSIVSDNMVLQRDLPLKIWGWASPGEPVELNFAGKQWNAVTGADRKWHFELPAMPAGGPYEMVLKGTTTITVRNILLGDVWVCSGQSNMDFQVYKAKELYTKEIADAGNNKIREFAVKNPYSFQRNENATGSWKQATPENVLMFSATGYFFARSLYDRYKVPIGIIHASYPGSPAEAWISEEALAKFPHYLEKARLFKDTAYANEVSRRDRRITQEWLAGVRRLDSGLLADRWSDNDIDLSSWRTYRLPGFWEEQGMGEIDGVAWIKKQIDVPASFLKGDVYLELGMIDDVDSTYFNGFLLGSKDNKYIARRYQVPDSVIRAGTNIITVRIIDKEGKGGVIAGRKYQLTNGSMNIDLSGNWYWKLGYAAKPLPAGSFTRIEYLPEIQYHSRIEPLTGYGIKGAAWYQGEANTGKAIEYRTLLPTMIADWRQRWGQGDFPFLIVQLANYMKPPAVPGKSNWALLRESQAIIAYTVPHSGLAVTIDLGEANDIHPRNKKDVGIRLALAAGHVAYGDEQTVYSGPVFHSMKIEKGKAILSFDHTGRGLVSKDGALKHFAIAGADQQFHWADAIIKGGKVVVWSRNVPAPVAVRYAWADNPEGCNLYNREGLPTIPFRTDQWPQ